MATPKQKDDMVNSFISSIPTMQTDIALLKQDTDFLKEASKLQSTKTDAIIDRLDKLTVVTPAEFEKHRNDEQQWKESFAKTMDERFGKIESFLSDSKPGISFVNALVSRWTTFLILLILIAAIVVGIGHIIPLGG